MLNRLIDAFQAKFPPNRLTALVMALLVPTVIVPLSAYLTVWVPAHLPGLPTFTAAQLTAYGIAGGTAAFLAAITAGYKFLDGWQKHEARTKGIGFYHEGLVSREDLPNDRTWVPVAGDPQKVVAAPELTADATTVTVAEIEAQSRERVAAIESGDRDLLDETSGNSAVSTAVPPPAPAPLVPSEDPVPPQS